MKLIPFSEILKMGKEAVDAAMAPAKVRQAKIQGELEIAKMDERIISLEQKVTERCAKHPIEYDKLLDAMDELALLERRKTQLTEVLAQLFPKE